MSIKIIGTGHILECSAKEVEDTISRERPDIIAIELDIERFRALEKQGLDTVFSDDDNANTKRVNDTKSVKARGVKSIEGIKDMFTQVVRGGSFPVLLEKLLGSIQKELGKTYGVYPGADMKAAIITAKSLGSKIALIDRGIDITMNHLLATPIKEKINLLRSRGTTGNDWGVIADMLGTNIENILKEENIERIMIELKRSVPSVYSALVDERDRYMARALYDLQRTHPGAEIVAVVGAGHKKGISRYIKRLEEGKEIGTDGLTDIRHVSKLQMLLLISMVLVAYILIRIRILRIG